MELDPDIDIGSAARRFRWSTAERMRLPSPTSPTCGILRVLACNVVRGWNRTTRITRPTRPSIPPLLRGYLRLGAVVCGAPAIDIDFRTADFLVLLDLRSADERYLRFFSGNAGRMDLLGVA